MTNPSDLQGMPAICEDSIRNYFNIVFDSAEGHIALRSFDEKGKKTKHKDDFKWPLATNKDVAISAMIAFAKGAAKNGKSAYCIPATTTLVDHKHGAEKKHILGSQVLLVDIDSGDVPRKLEHAKKHLGEPSMVVESGGVTEQGEKKLHVYWKLSNFVVGEELEKLIAYRETLAIKIEGDKSFKSTTQPIRIAGSIHNKEEPCLVTIRASNGLTYSLKDIFSHVESMLPLKHEFLQKDSTDDLLLIAANNNPLELSKEQIQEHLHNYPAERTNHHEWVEVGMALHHQYSGQQEGLKIWDAWSKVDKRPHQYQGSSSNKAKWNSFTLGRDNPITFATVMYRIKQQSEIPWAHRDIDITHEKPEPLRKTKNAAAVFPVDSLPLLLKEATLALHDKIQAPVALCAQSILAATTLVVQGHADIMLPIGQRRPISEYFLSIAESGERKSSCDNEALSAIKDYEAMLTEQYNINVVKWQNDNDAYIAERQSVLKKTKDLLAKQKGLDDLGQQPIKPLTPLIICPEPTFEGLCKLMQEGHPSLGIFSAEGGQFIAGHGMKEENKIRTATGLSGVWDGGAIKRVRASEVPSILNGRRLSMHLMVQPDIAASFLSDAALRDQGLLSRILIVAPVSTIGTRMQHEVKAKSLDDLIRFKEKLSEILRIKLPLKVNCSNELEPRAIRLSSEATVLWKAYVDHIERSIGANGELNSIRGFANKLPEHAQRLAAIMALFEDINTEELSELYLERAIALSDFYAEEALRLRDEGITDPKILVAEKLLSWINDQWVEENISLPDIYQSSIYSIKTKAKASEIVNILEDHGWLTRNALRTVVKGQRRQETWKIIKVKE